MHAKFLATTATALIVSGSPAAYAQSRSQGDDQASGSQYLSENPNSGPTMQGNQPGAGRSGQQAMLRQEMRQAGFRNIRILDATFLVQARTRNGDQVVMIINSRDVGSAVTTSSIGTSWPAEGQDSSAQRPQQFGTTGTAAPGLEQALDLRELTSPMVNPGLVEPGQMREYLQSRGFSDISSLRRNGSFFTGTAQYRGRQVSIRVDARNGLIVEPEQYLQSQFQQSGLR